VEQLEQLGKSMSQKELSTQFMNGSYEIVNVTTLREEENGLYVK